MKKNNSHLENLGVYGFEMLEPIILAALISGDPILLIGKSGTGKTYLLNSISEAMGLNHRHYNASLLSFDDIIGFPFPANNNTEVTFLPTPATIWKAESVLIDELSRCKPETQNKFFSIVHEKKIQGIQLDHLRYRWAAMNPFSDGADVDDKNYEGSNALDPALADRFAFIIEVPDWNELSKQDHELIIHPAGEGLVSNDQGKLLQLINKGKEIFNSELKKSNYEIVLYSRMVVNFLNNADIRMSPRRARQLARNLVAVFTAMQVCCEPHKEWNKKLFYKLVLNASLPHKAFKNNISQHVIDSAHAEAIRLLDELSLKDIWITQFLQCSSSVSKLKMLFDKNMDRDVKSLAIIQWLKNECIENSAAFAFACGPLLMELEILNDEAQNELSKINAGILLINDEVKLNASSMRELACKINTENWPTKLPFVEEMKNCVIRKRRANQYFYYLMTKDISVAYPKIAESNLHHLFTAAAEIKNNYSKKNKKK